VMKATTHRKFHYPEVRSAQRRQGIDAEQASSIQARRNPSPEDFVRAGSAQR